MIQPVAQLLAGPEGRDVLLDDLNSVARPRIAAHTGIAALDRKRPEAAEFDAFSTQQCRRDLVKDCDDDDLGVALL